MCTRHLPRHTDLQKENEPEPEPEQASRSNYQLTNTKDRGVCSTTSQECNEEHPHLWDKDPICQQTNFKDKDNLRRKINKLQ